MSHTCNALKGKYYVVRTVDPDTDNMEDGEEWGGITPSQNPRNSHLARDPYKRTVYRASMIQIYIT